MYTKLQSKRQTISFVRVLFSGLINAAHHHGLEHRAELNDRPVPLHEREVEGHLVSPRNRVQDQVQAPLGRCHRLRIARNDEVIGAQLAGGRLLLPVGGNGRHRVAHGLGQLQTHLAETSEAEDADIQAALGRSEPLERSKHGDAGAEDRSGKL